MKCKGRVLLDNSIRAICISDIIRPLMLSGPKIYAILYTFNKVNDKTLYWYVCLASTDKIDIRHQEIPSWKNPEEICKVVIDILQSSKEIPLLTKTTNRNDYTNRKCSKQCENFTFFYFLQCEWRLTCITNFYYSKIKKKKTNQSTHAYVHM